VVPVGDVAEAVFVPVPRTVAILGSAVGLEMLTLL
jgi:hypothetical protein